MFLLPRGWRPFYGIHETLKSLAGLISRVLVFSSLENHEDLASGEERKAFSRLYLWSMNESKQSRHSRIFSPSSVLCTRNSWSARRLVHGRTRFTRSRVCAVYTRITYLRREARTHPHRGNIVNSDPCVTGTHEAWESARPGLYALGVLSSIVIFFSREYIGTLSNDAMLFILINSSKFSNVAFDNYIVQV